MKRLCVTVLLVLVWSVSAAEVAKDCKRPVRPAVPDGENTTEPKLIEARPIIEQYLKAGDRYLVCLREFEDTAGGNITEVDGHELLGKYRGMVEEMYLVGDEFNIALRRFKLKVGVDEEDAQ